MSDSTAPSLEDVEARHYVAARSEVSMDTFREVVDSNFARSFQWLAKEGISPAGAPFIRIRSLDANGEPDEIDLGVWVADPLEPGDGLVSGELPGGRYVSYTHVGPYEHAELDGLVEANRKVLDWAREQGIGFACEERADGGQQLAASFEIYEVGPPLEEDFTKWETEILMMTGD